MIQHRWVGRAIAFQRLGDNDVCVGVIISAPFSVIAMMSSSRMPNLPYW